MDYLEFFFRFDPDSSFIGDLLMFELAEIGFESFAEEDGGIKAYIPRKIHNEIKFKEKMDSFSFSADISFTTQIVESRNWNEEWEKNYFQPIVIGEECVVHSTFHKNIPQAKYDILIDPKMAFGTGHHETTSLMIEYLLKAELEGKSLLDMGCGTAILAILAAKRGAGPVLGIDIDEWAYQNAMENILLNGQSGIKIEIGSAGLLNGSKKFDVILANINRNVLLQDLGSYVKSMSRDAELYMSGFYKEDMPVVNDEAEKYGLIPESFIEKNHWVAVKYKKIVK
jgi:ribosomal protein L11 methyltransferase